MNRYSRKQITWKVERAFKRLLVHLGIRVPSKRTTRFIEGRSRDISARIVREIRRHQRKLEAETKRQRYA